jgi:hypothetical protein
MSLGADALDEPRQGDADITRREARRIQLVMDGEEVRAAAARRMQGPGCRHR